MKLKDSSNCVTRTVMDLTQALTQIPDRCPETLWSKLNRQRVRPNTGKKNLPFSTSMKYK